MAVSPAAPAWQCGEAGRSATQRRVGVGCASLSTPLVAGPVRGRTEVTAVTRIMYTISSTVTLLRLEPRLSPASVPRHSGPAPPRRRPRQGRARFKLARAPPAAGAFGGPLRAPARPGPHDPLTLRVRFDHARDVHSPTLYCRAGLRSLAMATTTGLWTCPSDRVPPAPDPTPGESQTEMKIQSPAIMIAFDHNPGGLL
jgi:hypothetical protein